MKRKKRRRKKKKRGMLETDSNERNHNMLTGRRKHKRWMSGKEMRRE